MVYAGSIGRDKFKLGVSGRLKDSNLVMWDAETNSLWSQLRGEALYGPSKGKQLDMLPAVFVGLGTWSRMHPKTKVLDMSTVRQKGWFYKNTDLARGKVRAREFRGPMRWFTLGIGLRENKDRVVVALPRIHQDRVVELSVDKRPVAVVWDAEESAAFAYDRRVHGNEVSLRLEGSELRDGSGNRWNLRTGKELSADMPALARVPYVPTYVSAWQRYYPKSRVVD